MISVIDKKEVRGKGKEKCPQIYDIVTNIVLVTFFFYCLFFFFYSFFAYFHMYIHAPPSFLTKEQRCFSFSYSPRIQDRIGIFFFLLSLDKIKSTHFFLIKCQ